MQFSCSATYVSSKKHRNRFKHAEIIASQVCVVLRSKYCGILLSNVTVFKFLPRDAMHARY